MPDLKFTDLPRIADSDELHRVERDGALFFVKRGGKAHASFSCPHLEDERMMINKADWRIATASECRSLRVGWCDGCS
jgi:hypothetical protein